MAQTSLQVTPLKANNAAVNAGDLKVTLAAADNVNGNSFVATGREVLIISNPDVAAHTVTISSVADHLGRTGDIAAYSVPAGEVHAIALSTLEGWQQVSGVVNISANSNLLKIGVLRCQ